MPNTTTKTLTGLLGENLPLHGPYDPEAAVAATEAVAALVRYANYATLHPEAVPYPATTARVLGGLRDAIDRLPQLGRQLAARTATSAADPHAYLYQDGVRSHDAAAIAATVNALRDELSTVGHLAVALTAHLSTAQTLANRIGVDEPDPWSEQ